MITFYKETFLIDSTSIEVYDTLKWQINNSKINILGNKSASKKPFIGDISQSMFKVTRNKNIYSPLPNLIVVGNISQEDKKCKVFLKYKLNLLTILLAITFVSLFIASYISSPSNPDFDYSLLIQLCILVSLVIFIVLLLSIAEKNMALVT